jgi:hypothetical protein
MSGAITPLPSTLSWRGSQLKKAQGQLYFTCNFRDNSVGTALGYGLDDRGSRVRVPAGADNFSPHHRVQNGSGVHSASYPMCTRGSFHGGKAAGG